VIEKPYLNNLVISISSTRYRAQQVSVQNTNEPSITNFIFHLFFSSMAEIITPTGTDKRIGVSKAMP
jgi:hypothetical protein